MKCTSDISQHTDWICLLLLSGKLHEHSAANGTAHANFQRVIGAPAKKLVPLSANGQLNLCPALHQRQMWGWKLIVRTNQPQTCTVVVVATEGSMHKNKSSSGTQITFQTAS